MSATSSSCQVDTVGRPTSSRPSRPSVAATSVTAASTFIADRVEPRVAQPQQRREAAEEHDDRPEPDERRVVGVPERSGDARHRAAGEDGNRPAADVRGAGSARHGRERVQPVLVPRVRVSGRHLLPERRRSRAEAGRRLQRPRTVEVVRRRVDVHGDADGREAEVRLALEAEDVRGQPRRRAQPEALVAVDDAGVEAGRNGAEPGEEARRRGRREARVRGRASREQRRRRERERERNSCVTTTHAELLQRVRDVDCAERPEIERALMAGRVDDERAFRVRDLVHGHAGDRLRLVEHLDLVRLPDRRELLRAADAPAPLRREPPLADVLDEVPARVAPEVDADRDDRRPLRRRQPRDDVVRGPSPRAGRSSGRAGR